MIACRSIILSVLAVVLLGGGFVQADEGMWVFNNLPLETLKARGRQHALVIEHTENGQMVRGLLSLSQLCKQLGVTVETTEVADTFLEIEQQLAHV